MSPAVSYSKRLCGVAIFFFLSDSPLRGFSISLCLSVSVPISFLFVLFYFMMLCFFFFFPLCLCFFRHCGAFLSCQVFGARALSVSSWPSVSDFYIYIFYTFCTLQSSVSLSYISLDFSPLIPISLSNFASRLPYSLFPSCISIPLIKFQYAVSLSLLHSSYSFYCLLCVSYQLSFSPPLLVKREFSLDGYSAPGFLNQW